ncbi:MAG TPA: ATP-binding protein [Methylomirabilota bacterium]|nr:ATP-binding protein [Methylomirabilota bacterium]
MTRQQPTRLLLVEDSVADAGLLRAALCGASGTNHSVELVHVLRLVDALRYLQEATFDLVLLDLSLPDAQGTEALVRVQDTAPTLPVVIMTGLDDEELAIEAVRKGAQDYLVKGDVDSRMLVRAIQYAIERKRIDVQLQHQRERQAVLHEVNLAITATLDLHSILDLFLDKVSRLLPNFSVTVRLVNPDNDSLEPFACRAVDEAYWKRSLLSQRGGGRARAVMAARKPVVIVDALTDPNSSNRDFMLHNGLISYVGVPLVAQGECLGVIGFYTREKREFADEEVELLALLAGQAAVAMHNSQLYERLKTTNETLEKTLEVKGVLLGVMAHELKTPLQVIMGASSMLSSGMCGKLNDDQQERVEAIEAGADELRQLIESTLNMASLERGKVPLIVSEVCVSTLLTELKSEFSEAFRKKQIELDIDVPSCGFIIKTDRLKLKEIFRNLLENARKFTLKGKVEVRFAHQDRDHRVEFVVTDTGIGIKEELLAKVFELFYQVDPTMETEQASAGLGLNIVKRLVAALSGEVEVTSEVGKGTTFRISLPVEVASAQPY